MSLPVDYHGAVASGRVNYSERIHVKKAVDLLPTLNGDGHSGQLHLVELSKILLIDT